GARGRGWAPQWEMALLVIADNLFLEEILQRRMSGAEENPLEEGREDGETEVEEEYSSNNREIENMQQETEEDDASAWTQSQEEEGEEEEEGAERQEEEEEEGEGWEEGEREEVEKWWGEKVELGEEEEVEGGEAEEEEREDGEAEEGEEEGGEEEAEEAEEEEKEREVGEGVEDEVGGEEGEEEEWEEKEEGEGTEGGISREEGEKAGVAPEGEAAGTQEESKFGISLERSTPTESQPVLAGASSRTDVGHESGRSLKSESWGTSESLEGQSPQMQFLDLDQNISEEQRLSSPKRQLSDELRAATEGLSQDEVGQEKRDSKGRGRRERKPSHLGGSLVSTTTEDILFEKDDSGTVGDGDDDGDGDGGGDGDDGGGDDGDGGNGDGGGDGDDGGDGGSDGDGGGDSDDGGGYGCDDDTMTWSFGWNSSLPVYYIRNQAQRVILYACGHTAVIYNVLRNSQHHLQGHPNAISCLCVSEDRRWIATADKGPGCLVIVWDSYTGIPVHTIFDSCPEGSGIRAIAITQDAKYLATISDAALQKLCIWKWTLAAETPSCTLELPEEYGLQHYLIFNPTNNKELVSNSKTRAIYYVWNEKRGILFHSAPVLTEKTFNKLVGRFSQSAFHLNLTQILSATMEGKLVVWAIHRPPLSAGTPHIKPCKLVHLQKEGITVLTTVDSYIVTGDIKGAIKFYDHTLSIVSWYSQFKLSPIRTLSFSKTPARPPTDKSDYPPDCTLKGDLFVVRNLIIGTSDATVYHLTADGTKLEKLFVEPKDAICAISCHPYQPLLAVGSFCGMIKVWDYEKKTYLFSRVFERRLGVQSLTYNPEGALLGVGFTEGTVSILDAMSLENSIPEPFRYSRTSVTHVSFSHDSQYMATADGSFAVAVYKVAVRKGQRVWEYLARLRSHRKSIRSLLFGVHLDSNDSRLLSLGRDCLLPAGVVAPIPTRAPRSPQIEYNLFKSCKDHLEVLDIHRTDQGSYPTCMVWYPPLSKELFLLVCNSGYKVKLFNSTTKMCRKTLLGPVFGSPMEQMQVLPVTSTLELQKRHLVFINRDKVGLQILPVDGNPHKTTAIVCHPSGVSGMALSYDGRYAFTAGGQDRSVVQWEINLSALEAAVSLGGEDLTPFYGLVSGGREGKFYRELEDYFYYSQLRSQGIDTMETRRVSEHIRLPELPFVMRAVGFYPSEEKIEDMFNEVRFSEYVETGKVVDKINLPDFLRVYVNHRPPFGNTLSGILESFEVLGVPNAQGKKVIRREDFLRLLLTRGEHMTEEEMADCFATLFGLNPEGWKSEPSASSFKGSEICFEKELPEEISAETFTTEILGLTISQGPGEDAPAGEAVWTV
ncbi:Cilia- and flagella-associated protein 251, partial [Galemys pyrenaicus]